MICYASERRGVMMKQSTHLPSSYCNLLHLLRCVAWTGALSGAARRVVQCGRCRVARAQRHSRRASGPPYLIEHLNLVSQRKK